ncbi:galactoside O-acetyltransferase [Neocallimastix lanati (nom. inval.)]|nr:galactoside O-acetyltransferase [Neocallimastix sp. JGI-2020a]
MTNNLSEWDLMKKGLVYNDFDTDLVERRVVAKNIFREFNKTDDSETEKRKNLLTKLFNKIGERVFVEPDFTCEFGKNITIGNDVYINFGCIILDCGDVTIGNHVLIGPRLGIYSANHCILPEERIAGGIIAKPVNIEDNVWIGGDVKILAGVTIGEGSIIGAGSIVTKDIPPRVIAAGNPCKVIRKITKDDKTDYLDRINAKK